MMAGELRPLGLRFLAVAVLGFMILGVRAAAASTTGTAHTYWPDAPSEISEHPTLIKLGFEPNADPAFGPTFVMIGTGYVGPGFPAISWSS